MKAFFHYLPAFALALLVASCTTEEVATRQNAVKLNKDSVAMLLGSRPLFVAEAYRITATDSMDFLKVDTIAARLRKVAYMSFHVENGYINYWFGSEINEAAQMGASYTFSMNIRIERPAGLRAKWDEDKGTLIVESEAHSVFPMIVPGKKAYLETGSFKFYSTLEEARDAVVKGGATFIYEDTDPKLGKVTYKIRLKPMYQYYRAPNQQNDAKFAVF
jgi:hypothetical protein